MRFLTELEHVLPERDDTLPRSVSLSNSVTTSPFSSAWTPPSLDPVTRHQRTEEDRLLGLLALKVWEEASSARLLGNLRRCQAPSPKMRLTGLGGTQQEHFQSSLRTVKPGGVETH